MEVQQCMKLTVTNRSIGLIVLIVHAHPTNSMSHLFRALAAPGRRRSPKKKTCSQKTNEGIPFYQLLERLPLADLVVMAGWPHPFPFRTRP